MLDGKNQSQKNKCCIIQLIWGIWVTKLLEAENGTVVAGGGRVGGGRNGELSFNGYKVLVMQDEKIVEICCTIVCIS